MEKNLRARRMTIASIILVLTIVVDQVTKFFARKHLVAFHEINILGPFVRLTHAENPGAFLSLGSQLSDHSRFGIFTVLVLVFLIWAIAMLYRKITDSNLAFLYGWSFLIAGGIGNVIDRIDKGTVTDFLIFAVGPLQTGVLNIADVAITGGILVVLFFAREGAAKPASNKAGSKPEENTNVV